MSDVRGVLLDIEGTTTPISFVHEILFPYARSRLDASVADAGNDSVISAALRQLHSEWEAERSTDPTVGDFGSGAPYAHRLMDLDRKSTGLKALQGIIWRQGYHSGLLRGPVFDDVPPAFRAWTARGIRLRIFSSGSVLAQKLLFRHTERGDLTPYIDGYYDTTTGPKNEEPSYRRIAAGFDLPADEILFLSDIVAELDAARAAGLRTSLMLRPGNRPTQSNGHPTHQDFSDLP